MNGADAEEWVREFERLYDLIRALHVPVIAAVSGWAMGAGCQLALLADIRISSTTAKYGMPEIQDGIPAIFGLGLLWHLIGMSRSLYLVLSGDTLKARQALQAGRSEEHTSELQSHSDLVCRLLLEKKKRRDFMRCAALKQLAHTLASRRDTHN